MANNRLDIFAQQNNEDISQFFLEFAYSVIQQHLVKTMCLKLSKPLIIKHIGCSIGSKGRMASKNFYLTFLEELSEKSSSAFY